MKIRIDLHPEGSVGTVATVTRSRWLFWTVTEEFVCFKSAYLTNSKWVSRATGLSPDEYLELRLSIAAEAAALLAKDRERWRQRQIKAIQTVKG